MIDRDNGPRPSSAARDAPADFMAVFGGNDNRYTAAEGTPGSRPVRVKSYLYGYLGSIPIIESNVLIIDLRPSCVDGFSGARCVFAVGGSVFGGDGKASRVTRDFEGVAAVGADIDFLRRIDGRPYPGRGDDAAFRGVGGFGGGDDFAPYGGGVGILPGW